MRARTAGVALLVLLVAAQAQGRSSTCIVQYEHHNQIDYGPLIVQEVKGTITDPQQVAVPKVCVGIFTENDHKLIATTESDADGKFSLQTVPPGRYRLSFSPLLLSRRRISFSGVAAQLCLLCALLPQVLYSVRSERMLMETGLQPVVPLVRGPEHGPTRFGMRRCSRRTVSDSSKVLPTCSVPPMLNLARVQDFEI